MKELFTDEQNKAWDLLCGEDNIFLTGEAGSGKSFVIREFIKDKDPKEFPVLASTGAAAVLIGGRTFHSFMGLGIMEGGVERTIERAINDRRLVSRLKKAKGFVLDEVSMISGPTLRAAEAICKIARENLDLPWGGLRVIMVGDFAQLPPVQRGSHVKPWAFLDPIWKNSGFKPVMLKQNMRSGQDVPFLEVLNYVRSGVVNDKVRDFLNKRTKKVSQNFDGTRLFPLRKQADSFNMQELGKIDEEELVYPTIYTGSERSIAVVKKNSPLPEELTIKKGCLVMLRQNDPKQRWVNGSTGIVLEANEEFIRVELMTGKIARIEKVSFSLLDAEGVVVAAATNFPMTLAYAATIHKAQGMTLDSMSVDLSRLWEPGQAYVALSRIVNSENLFIESWRPNSIKADLMVRKYYDYVDQLNLSGS